MKPEYRNISSSPGSSFRVSFFEDEEFPAAWHFHPQYELTYIIRSTGIRYVGDSIQNFEPGDLVLVGGNLPHCWMTVGEQNENVQCIILQWDNCLLENWLDRPEFRSIKTLLELSHRGVQFNLNTPETLEGLLIELQDKDPFNRFLGLLSVLQKLALETHFKLLASNGYSNSLPMNQSGRINTIYTFVKENHLRQISLQEAAENVNMGKEAFCRFFKRTFNKSFFSFVNEYKVNLACKLLVDTDLTVSEIGFRVGYNNLTFFHRQFMRFVRVSPSKYRKSYRRILV